MSTCRFAVNENVDSVFRLCVSRCSFCAHISSPPSAHHRKIIEGIFGIFSNLSFITERFGPRYALWSYDIHIGRILYLASTFYHYFVCTSIRHGVTRLPGPVQLSRSAADLYARRYSSRMTLLHTVSLNATPRRPSVISSQDTSACFMATVLTRRSKRNPCFMTSEIDEG